MNTDLEKLIKSADAETFEKAAAGVKPEKLDKEAKGRILKAVAPAAVTAAPEKQTKAKAPRRIFGPAVAIALCAVLAAGVGLGVVGGLRNRNDGYGGLPVSSDVGATSATPSMGGTESAPPWSGNESGSSDQIQSAPAPSGNYYNSEGRIINVSMDDSLYGPFPSLDELLQMWYDEHNEIQGNTAIIKGRIAGGSFNLCAGGGDPTSCYLNKLSFMLTPIMITAVVDSGNECNYSVGDIVYVREFYLYINDALLKKDLPGDIELYRKGDYIQTSKDPNRFLLQPEREYLFFAQHISVEDYTEHRTCNYDLSEIGTQISDFAFAYCFDTTEKPTAANFEKEYIACYDEVIAKYCG